ncbi:hypothetical protein [Flagellimonas sp.]|uniref:hypothetical protein n=1 Tax=Flagellimonas sp. TaxID=2058762 RepID=UPI003F4A1F4F
MKAKAILLIVIPLVLCSSLVGCSAEDGETGPQGPQGEQGLQGEQGPQGQPGVDGTDGADGQDANSTVISSGWFEIDTWDTDLADFKFHRIPDLILSELERENNVFLIYRRYQPNPSITRIDLLPLYVLDINGSIELAIRNRISGNGLFLQIESYGRSVASDEYLGPETLFRYIIIAPPSTDDKRNPMNYAKMSYEEVIEYLGIDP